MSFLDIFTLVYLGIILLSLIINPRVVASLAEDKAVVEVRNRHVIVAFILSILPLINLVVLFVCFELRPTIKKLSTEYEGVEHDRKEFEKYLKNLQSRYNKLTKNDE